MLPLSACCMIYVCIFVCIMLPLPPQGFPYLIRSVLPSVLTLCTGLNMVTAVVSGNVSWYLVGQPSAGCLVLFEKPK